MRREPSRCRACGSGLFPDPLLRLEAMPATAQGFPDAATLPQDRAETLDVRQCATCGLVQLTGEPVPYYREVIRAAAFSDEMRQFRQTQFAEWVEQYALFGRKVVEIGCGRGEYLTLLHEAGVAAHGLEYGRDAVRACRALGLTVHRGYPTRHSRNLPSAPFDAFIALNFIEHWPDPVGSLRAVAESLAPGAVGLIEVPNFDMILRQGLFSEFIHDHLLYFTEDSFRFVLTLAGFELLECRNIWHDYIISAVVRKRAALDVRILADRRDRLTAALRQFVGQFPTGQVAVWGAGHQALAMIALTGIAPHLRYVVDSAPFKQGKLTPATHLPIFPPDTLRSDPVAAVIVMAASYSNEVIRTLRRDYPAELQMAVLRDWGLECR